MAASEKVRPALLFLMVCCPVVLGFSLEDGPRWWYVGEAALVAVLLCMLWPQGGAAWRAVCALGCSFRLVVAWCGVLTDSGACAAPGEPSTFSLVVLSAISVCASIVGTKTNG